MCVGVGVCVGLLSIGDLRVGGASPTEVVDQLRIRIGFIVRLERCYIN